MPILMALMIRINEHPSDWGIEMIGIGGRRGIHIAAMLVALAASADTAAARPAAAVQADFGDQARDHA
ncbi:MAG: hypothetical protein EOP65_09705, partial [Sphingomonas sp.]